MLIQGTRQGGQETIPLSCWISGKGEGVEEGRFSLALSLSGMPRRNKGSSAGGNQGLQVFARWWLLERWSSPAGGPGELGDLGSLSPVLDKKRISTGGLSPAGNAEVGTVLGLRAAP